MENIEAVNLVIAIGALFAVALVLDQVRRARRRRYENIAVSKQAKKSAYTSSSDGLGLFGEQLDADPLLDGSDSAFGGSRVVGVRDDSDVNRLGEQLRQQTIERATLSAFREPAQESLEFKDEPETSSSVAQPAEKRSTVSEEMAIVHLLASRGSAIQGGSLRDAVLAAGLRYGEMKIFHYYADANDRDDEELLFSLANAVKPGNFELREIEQLTTPGVTLFLNFNQVSDASAALEKLITVVDQLAGALSLQVLDETRSSMTRQTLDHLRQRARAVAVQRQRSQDKA